MKANIGVDSRNKLIHSVAATAANVADSTVLPDLLHGDETRVCGDQAYRDQREVIRDVAPQARDCTNRRYRYKDRIDEVERAKNQTKSQVRAKVEHVFGTLKYWKGATHFLTRGLEHVGAEMALHVLAYNFKRVLNLLGMARTMEAVRMMGA